MRTLARGTEGDDVARLQALLCLSGFDAKPIDGDFGAGTERAVIACQAGRGLPATGTAEEVILNALGMDKPDPTKTPVPVCARVSVAVDADSSPFYRRPVGLDSHPRTIFEEDSEAAGLIRSWIEQGGP